MAAMTSNPRPANSSAVARPRPRPAPVTRARPVASTAGDSSPTGESSPAYRLSRALSYSWASTTVPARISARIAAGTSSTSVRCRLTRSRGTADGTGRSQSSAMRSSRAGMASVTPTNSIESRRFEPGGEQRVVVAFQPAGVEPALEREAGVGLRQHGRSFLDRGVPGPGVGQPDLVEQLAGLVVDPEWPPGLGRHELLEADHGQPPGLVDVGVMRQGAGDRIPEHGAHGATGRQQAERFVGQVAGDEQRLGEQGRRHAHQVVHQQIGEPRPVRRHLLQRVGQRRPGRLHDVQEVEGPDRRPRRLAAPPELLDEQADAGGIDLMAGRFGRPGEVGQQLRAGQALGQRPHVMAEAGRIGLAIEQPAVGGLHEGHIRRAAHPAHHSPHQRVLSQVAQVPSR